MKSEKEYRKRILDAILERKLTGADAVLVEGPKWCGKTTTCGQHAKSVLYMADPVRRDRYLMQASVDITELLKGEQPRLIDEWQDAPKFWDAIRYGEGGRAACLCGAWKGGAGERIGGTCCREAAVAGLRRQAVAD